MEKQKRSIYQSLSAIQKELKAPKGQFNKFANFSYRSCEDILEAVKPLLDGCYLTINDKIIKKGDRYYVEATATLVNGSEEIKSVAYAREAESKKGMDEAQITGATSSYARKYALNGLFAIDDTKDADTAKPPKETPIEVFNKAKAMITGTSNVNGLIDYSDKLKTSKKFNATQKKELQSLISAKVDALQ